uniref:DUF4258 domain-containing protein n=1 Tax=Candidatus Caldatribacterium saccharofermentans TaxID=1454753 RepID=A0A7V4WLM2_9BACT
MEIRLTIHAREKLSQRNIPLELVRLVVLEPELTLRDRNDPELIHYVRGFEGKFLRVLGRWEKEGTFLLVSAFFDRRLRKAREGHDQDSVR